MAEMAEDHFLNLQPGTVVNGRYEIVKCLGAGSMGMVYACRHRELSGHLVAMKVLFSEVARDSVAAARFRNEIVASYGVSHANVVRAYEYFRDGDLIAFTMEYISGGDLADRISSDQAIPIPEIIRFLSQMCSGVQAIHDAGIIHRDLKPENILLTAQGDIKITDFGIARTGTGPKLTEHGGVVGTIDYVSPEYLERGQVDGRSDIYSLGVLAYEMVTGEPPFKGKSVIETMTMRLKTDPKPPHLVRADCPKELSDIVMRAMARDPDRGRYQSALEMGRDLEALKNGTFDTRGESRRSLPAVSDGVPTNLEGTTVIPQKTGGAPRRVLAADTSANFYEEAEQMESVLRPHIGSSGSHDKHSPNVAVSQSHLSADRMRKLSSDLSADDSVWKTLLWFVAVILLGMGVGLIFFSSMVDYDSEQPLGINEEVSGKK